MVEVTRLSIPLALFSAFLALGSTAIAAPPPKGKRPPAKAPAAPPDSPDVIEAREHFNRAQALYDGGHADAALLELQRAYAVKPNYRLLFNIGSIAFTTHDYVLSLKSFDQFLKEGGSEIEPGKRAEAESRLVTLRVLVGQARITVDVDGAAISVDDEPIGTSPLAAPWLVNAGKHRILATKEGYLPGNLVVTVLGGDPSDANIHLARILPPAPPAPPAPEKPPPSAFTPLSWVGITASVGLAAGAVVMGISSANSRSDLKGITFAGPTPSQEYTDKQHAVTTKRTIAFVLGGASAAVLTTTLIITLTRKNPAKPAQGTVGLGVGPGDLSITGGF